jgi:hypothetical protein
LEFTYQSLKGVEDNKSSYSDLSRSTTVNYIVFAIVNLLLTILGAVVIYLMSNRITKDLNLMAQLLLKIEKS